MHHRRGQADAGARMLKNNVSSNVQLFSKCRQLEVLSIWPVRTRRMLGYIAVHISTTIYTAFHCKMYCGKNYKRELLAGGNASAARTLVSKHSLVSLHHPRSG